MSKTTPESRSDATAPGDRTGLRADGKATRDRILDAAEMAFATAPYDGVSLRRITGDAGVNLALVKYYFASKENLFAAVVARRAPDLCRLRMQRLAEIQAEGPPDLKTVIGAYMRPLFDQMKSEDPGWPNYVRMIAFMAQDARFDALMSEHFDETARAFFAVIRAAVPEAKEADVLCGLTFLLTLTVRCLSGEMRCVTLADRKAQVTDLEEFYDHLMPFCSAGMIALMNR
ncbi:TetR/AcrR family transcriptional regulator [Pseudooceanicola sp. 200-1SW]|uniref:TetR/AcrR family transcriptional regulator n=1 Tax=Pseudooceanicola sp. 200-1SW TaxID=3425949 RepID=UPI003D7F2F22